MILNININERASKVGRDILLTTYLPPLHYISSRRHSLLKCLCVFADLCPPSITSRFQSLHEKGLSVMVIIGHDRVVLGWRWGRRAAIKHIILGAAPPILFGLATIESGPRRRSHANNTYRCLEDHQSLILPILCIKVPQHDLLRLLPFSTPGQFHIVEFVVWV